LWGSDWAIGVSDRSRLIKTPDWISERPPRGGLSYLRSSFSDCPQWHLADKSAAPTFVRYWTKADKGEFWAAMVWTIT